MSIKKSEIKLQVNNNTANAYLAAPEQGGPGVLVLHAWWGLKPFFKQVCDQLAGQGFTALAPDYYQGNMADTIEDAEALRGKVNQEISGDIIQAAHAHLAALGQPIGVIGFSMGASWALLVAANEPDIAAVVQFYGAGEADYGNFKARVLGHFSDVDAWEPLEWVRKMEADMKSAGVDVTHHIYPGVAHWFVEADRPEYDAAAASLAWSRTYEFLRKNL
jgi:carboxymethylenebutenolidase